jgi:hypothetical protein
MWRDDARLLDMPLAARELDKYTEGVSFEAFDRNRLLRREAICYIDRQGFQLSGPCSAPMV